jgi:hypothetical protein
VPPGPGVFDATYQGLHVPVTAQIEHDADNDGYGDETQDACPTNASTQGACPLPTTLGRTLAPSASDCGGNSYIPTGPADYRFSAPADGVVTSWSYLSTADLDGTLKLKIFRPLGGVDYMAVADSAPETPTAANALNTFSTRISVRQGDRIAVHSADLPCTTNVGPGSHIWAPGDPAPNSTTTFPNSSQRAVDLSAVVEADADGDGYGDTSQDLCPTDASTQGTCPIIGPPLPPEKSAECLAAEKKLDKAKAKLKKLKKGDAKAKKLDKATEKVRKAKKAVKKAC